MSRAEFHREKESPGAALSNQQPHSHPIPTTASITSVTTSSSSSSIPGPSGLHTHRSQLNLPGEVKPYVSVRKRKGTADI